VRDDYYASATTKVDGVARTYRIDSAEGRLALRDARLLGFVEGNSLGRISARFVNDPPTLFNLWRRQDFDQPVDSLEDGGKVWEHWCTLRDIRQSSRIGTAVLTAYVSLVAALGDLFVPTVARGRRTYGHPKQLAAMVQAGFVGHGSAVAKIDPVAIPAEAEPLLLEALPASSLEAAEIMRWKASPQYYMFHRKIRSWSTVAQVRADLKSF
jgi:hypothetical protein